MSLRLVLARVPLIWSSPSVSSCPPDTSAASSSGSLFLSVGSSSRESPSTSALMTRRPSSCDLLQLECRTRAELFAGRNHNKVLNLPQSLLSGNSIRCLSSGRQLDLFFFSSFSFCTFPPESPLALPLYLQNLSALDTWSTKNRIPPEKRPWCRRRSCPGNRPSEEPIKGTLNTWLMITRIGRN